MNAEELRALLAAVGRGDEAAFARLLQAYGNNIFGVAMTYSKSREASEEVVQDVFLKVWKRREQLSAIENFEGWLYIIARNRILNAMRDGLVSSNTSYVLPDTFAVEDRTPYVSTEARDRYQLLLRGIETLPEKRKLVFKMSRLQGKTHKEIAQELGIHEITVAQYIIKALHTLREYLRANGLDSILILILLRGIMGDDMNG